MRSKIESFEDIVKMLAKSKKVQAKSKKVQIGYRLGVNFPVTKEEQKAHMEKRRKAGLNTTIYLSKRKK